MKKTTKTIIAVIVVIALIAVVAVMVSMNSKTKTNLETITSEEDLSALIEQIYEGQTMEMPMVETRTIDIEDSYTLKSTTGLDNADNIEFVVASEPLMSSQAYSLVLVKVKNGVDINSIAKEMNENINERKWVCVSAEKVYTTSSGNVVCLVMSSEELAKPIYEKFKTLAGSVMEEFERAEEEIELPPEMF